MAHKDAARTPKRTKAELLRAFQDGCKKTPCASIVQGVLKCPFCPWHKRYYLSESE